MPWSYRPALDGLRSIAVYLVLLFHTGMPAVGGGFIGVDLFFVLSGFLVSNVILSEIDERGTLRFGRFYARRIRRLLPAAVVVILATCLVFLLVTTVVRRLPLVRDAQSALLYVANWRFLGQQNDYFATTVDESPFLHFWSLAIEEQFYFLFPVVLLLLSKAGRHRARALLVGLSSLFLLSLAAQLYWAVADPNHAYYGTDARLYQLLAGALLAVALRSWSAHPKPGVVQAATAVGLGGLLLLGSGLVELSPSARGIGAMLASSLLIAGLMTGEHGFLGRILSRPGPVYLGKISYGTYLWHWPVILVIEELLTVRPFVIATLAIGVSTGLAALSYEVFEMPIRRAPVLNRFRWNVVVVGVATSALVAVAAVPPVLESDRKPRLAAAASAGSGGTGVDAGSSAPADAPVPVDIDWKKISDEKGPEANCPVEDVAPCILVRGDGPHLLLVGDSHARMLGPMFVELAKEHDLTLSLNVIPSCPWQADVVNTSEPPKSQQKCLSGRQEWYEKALPKLDPDLVVLSSLARDKVEFRKLERVGGSDESLAELNLATTNETLALIESKGARALIVETMLRAPFEPLDCLARASRLSQCDVPVPLEAAPSDAYYETADVLSDNVFTVNLNPIMCPAAPRCSPVVDDIVVWRNDTHFTTDITVHFRDRVWRAIKSTGALAGMA